jgi:hypothetical protein
LLPTSDEPPSMYVINTLCPCLKSGVGCQYDLFLELLTFAYALARNELFLLPFLIIFPCKALGQKVISGILKVTCTGDFLPKICHEKSKSVGGLFLN